jgi:hypothetical protein
VDDTADNQWHGATALWAIGAFLLYFGVSWFIPEIFPFSRYEMFSYANENKLAVPFFTANDQLADTANYKDFKGIPPDNIDIRGEPGDMKYKVEEDRNWVRSHLAASSVPPGPVRCRFGFYIVSIGTDGHVRVETRSLAQGSAYSISQ